MSLLGAKFNNNFRSSIKDDCNPVITTIVTVVIMVVIVIIMRRRREKTWRTVNTDELSVC